MSSSVELLELASRLLTHRDEPVAIDTETTGFYHHQDDELRGISVTFMGTSYYFPVTHADEQVARPALREFFRALALRPGKQVYHHAVFDWAFLEKLGLGFEVPTNCWDTQVGAWLEDENMLMALKAQGALWFGDDAKAEQAALKKLFKGKTITECLNELKAEYPDAKVKDLREESRARSTASKRTWDTLTAEEIGAYAAKDTELTMRLYDRQRAKGEEYHGAHAREMDFQHTLYRMMQTGIRVNPDAARGQLEVAEKRIAEIEAQFEVNLASPDQLAGLVYDDWELPCIHTTGKGKRSVARAALEELEGRHEGIDLILEHRRLAKAIGTYYRPMLERLAPDGRIHAVFGSTTTVTGRISCAAPNLMTIPRGDTLEGIRDLFVPEPGMELWSYDLNSAELRVMAGWAEEEAMLSAIIEGRDLHGETALSIFGQGWTPLQRRLAKNLNYGFAYGIQARKFATYMTAGTGRRVISCSAWLRWRGTPPASRRCGNCTVCQAEEILEGYRRTYPRLTAMMDGLQAIAKRDGVLPLHVDGRYRHFRSPGVQVGYYTALNALVQGGIGEFMKDIMLIAPASVRDYAWLCLQVHDELVFEVVPGYGERLGRVLQGVADEINPFPTRMIWNAQEWSDHD